MLKDEREEGSTSAYLAHLGGFFVFVGFGGLSLIFWGLYWHCWLKKSCCLKEYHNPVNIRAFWWISFIGFCGMLACCISGFITSVNFKNMVGSVKCAYERIYYDSQYGELKDSGFIGLKNMDKLIDEYKKFITNNDRKKNIIYPNISGLINEEELKNFGNASYFINILDEKVYYSKDFINKIYELIVEYCKNEIVWDDNNEIICNSLNSKNDQLKSETYLAKYIKNATRIMKYFSDEIDNINDFVEKINKNKNTYSRLVNKVNNTLYDTSYDLNNYEKNFLDKAYHYINISKSCGYILVIVFYSILLALILCGCFLLWAYSYLKEQQILFTFMHIFWNILKFFIFCFFLFGAAFGILYICAKDLIGYNEFLFSKENLSNAEMTYLLPSGESKEFLKSCLYDENSNYLNSIESKININIYNMYNNLKLMKSSKYSLENNNYNEYKQELSYYSFSDYSDSQIRNNDEADSTEEPLPQIDFSPIGDEFEKMVNDTYKLFYPNTNSLRNLDGDESQKTIAEKIEDLSGTIESYNCTFLKTEIQILYDALYEVSVESRISCALCCCIGFFGEVSVIFYLLVMYHYNNVQFSEGMSFNNKNISRDKGKKFDMESQNEFMDKRRPPNLKKNNKRLDLEFDFKI